MPFVYNPITKQLDYYKTTSGDLSNIALNTAHRLGDGSDHAYIDQDVSTIASPSFVALTSTITTGTSPFNIASTTLNTNLNADLLDGVHGIDFLTRVEWKQNGFENRTDSTISFDDGTHTFSIQPTVTNFDYWMEGIKYTSTGDTLEIDDTQQGIHVIYYDATSLTEAINPTQAQIDTVIRTKCIVSIIGWDVSASESIYTGDERHGKDMSPSSHSYLHFIEGLRYISGLGLNTMSVDGTGTTADAQFGVDLGDVADEDIYWPISAVNSTTGLPILHMTGANGDWHKTTVAGFSARTYDNTSSTRLAYNQYTGGAWQLTEITNNDFVLYHVFATTEKDTPMISVMGQDTYANRAQARAGALVEIRSLVLSDLLLPEIRPIATVIYQTNLGYASAINARTISTDEGDDYIDWRSETISRAEISTSDHGALTGLGDNDHPQYLLAASPFSAAGFGGNIDSAVTTVQNVFDEYDRTAAEREWDGSFVNSSHLIDSTRGQAQDVFSTSVYGSLVTSGTCNLTPDGTASTELDLATNAAYLGVGWVIASRADMVSGDPLVKSWEIKFTIINDNSTLRLIGADINVIHSSNNGTEANWDVYLELDQVNKELVIVGSASSVGGSGYTLGFQGGLRIQKLDTSLLVGP